jgi:vacuolar-type H+-ATPase subunit I/STV1
MPSPSETPAPANQAPANTPPQEGDDKWEARFKTLSGKYNAEVPRLHAAIKERDSKLNSLTEEVEALKARMAAPQEKLVSAEEVSEFGEPLVDLIRRAAREEVQAKDNEIKELNRKLESLVGTTTASVEVSFYDRLAMQVPDWQTINDDPEFHTWLSEVDDLTGAQRQDILSQAEEKRDADRVARFFKAFKKVHQDRSAASTASLESQVAPEATRTPEVPKGKKLWTRAEIAAFYAADRRGAYTEEQAAAIDAEIQSAIREQRVR